MVLAPAMIFDQAGMQVAIYANGTAHLQKVGMGQDDGAQVQTATGLKAGER